MIEVLRFFKLAAQGNQIGEEHEVIDIPASDVVQNAAPKLSNPSQDKILTFQQMKRRIKMACLDWAFVPALDGGLVYDAGGAADGSPRFFYCSAGPIEPNFLSALTPRMRVYVYRGTNRIIAPISENLALLVKHYADEIELIQESGPVYLGGYCEAALVQWALTHELARRGREVALLALIDLPLAPRRGAQRVIYDAAALTRTSINGVVHVFNRPRDVWPKIVKRSRKFFSGGSKAQPDEYRVRSYRDWVLEPLPSTFQGQVLLICGSRGVGAHLRFGWAQADWRRLTRDLLEIAFVPGAHTSLQWPKIADAVCGHMRT